MKIIQSNEREIEAMLPRIHLCKKKSGQPSQQITRTAQRAKALKSVDL